MADFATEFITKLNGKLTPEQMKVVLNELEIFSDDYNIEKKCRDVAVPDDLLPACYKVYMVSKKIEGMSPQSLITYKCYLEQFLYAVGKPVEKITANDIRLYLYGLVGKNSDHTIDTKRIVINTFLDWCCLEYYIPENPCAKIHAIKYEEKPREPLDGIEMEMVRDACVDLRERAMIEFSTVPDAVFRKWRSSKKKILISPRKKSDCSENAANTEFLILTPAQNTLCRSIGLPEKTIQMPFSVQYVSLTMLCKSKL